MKAILVIQDKKAKKPGHEAITVHLKFVPPTNPDAKATLALVLSSVAMEAIANEIKARKEAT